MPGILGKLQELWPRLEIARRSALFGSLCAVIAALCMLLPPVQLLDEWLCDVCFQLRGVRPTNTKAVVIGFDDATLRDEEFSKPLALISPELARVVHFLHEQGARAIGIDFLVPERLEDWGEINQSNGLGNPASLRNEIRDAGNVSLIETVTFGRTVKPLRAWRVPHAPQTDGMSTDLACVQLTEDRDFVVRRQGLFFLVPEHEQGDPVPRSHLALALASISQGRPVRISADKGLSLGDEPIPVDSDRLLRINYVGPPGTFPVISVHDILANRVSDEQRALVHGAIALVGVTARSQQDYQVTPYSNRLWRMDPTQPSDLMAGIELHGNTLATILDRKFLHRLHPWQEFIVLLAVGIALVAVDVYLGLWRSVPAAIVVLCLWQAVAVWALRQSALQLPLAGIWLVQVAAFACASGMRLNRLRNLFGSVNARQIANLLERTPSHRLLKGEERSITILFADMRGFSTFSRNRPPQAVIRLLNTYFAAIVPVIERHGGTVNRYIGDAVLVLFNAPQTFDDHAVRAVRAAVEMVETVHLMKSTWEALDFPDLGISVGINTGHVVVALVGSPKRLDYTAHGDAVNAAARIETENRKQGTEILIASTTWRLLPHQERERLHCSPLPMTVDVKGVGTVEIHAVDVAKRSS